MNRRVFFRSAMEIAEGERLPWWAGVAWQSSTSWRVVILPIGVNWIAAWIRRAWHAVRMAKHWRSPIDAARAEVREAYNLGKMAAMLEHDEQLRRIESKVQLLDDLRKMTETR